MYGRRLRQGNDSPMPEVSGFSVFEAHARKIRASAKKNPKTGDSGQGWDTESIETVRESGETTEADVASDILGAVDHELDYIEDDDSPDTSSSQPKNSTTLLGALPIDAVEPPRILHESQLFNEALPHAVGALQPIEMDNATSPALQSLFERDPPQVPSLDESHSDPNPRPGRRGSKSRKQMSECTSAKLEHQEQNVSKRSKDHKRHSASTALKDVANASLKRSAGLLPSNTGNKSSNTKTRTDVSKLDCATLPAGTSALSLKENVSLENALVQGEAENSTQYSKKKLTFMQKAVAAARPDVDVENISQPRVVWPEHRPQGKS
ncbi:uncharacterized protein LOC135397108 isoform X2 [Ornithodoros turicata]|uniref:uncharacterized protein LOC135397108 isoform X2 n=1 Tax=Ornithodoros turicata TaxID=34597 RepID=UPI003138812D